VTGSNAPVTSSTAAFERTGVTKSAGTGERPQTSHAARC
jgi:hypothetical protein